MRRQLTTPTMSKKTLVIGASHKPERYSNKAIRLLTKHGHEAVALGRRASERDGIDILSGAPELKDIDTVTLYINAKLQPDYYDYIFSLEPKRIIFNPGTENPELFAKAKEKGIDVENACTLVLLRIGGY